MASKCFNVMYRIDQKICVIIGVKKCTTGTCINTITLLKSNYLHQRFIHSFVLKYINDINYRSKNKIILSTKFIIHIQNVRK